MPEAVNTDPLSVIDELRDISIETLPLDELKALKERITSALTQLSAQRMGYATPFHQGTLNQALIAVNARLNLLQPEIQEA